MTTTPITLVFNTDDGLDDAVMAEAYVLTPDGPAQVLVDTQKLRGAAAIQFFYRYPNAKKYGLSQCACHAGAASFAAAHGFVTTNMSLKTEDSLDDSGDHIEITVNAPLTHSWEAAKKHFKSGLACTISLTSQASIPPASRLTCSAT